jgi:3D (Asp-Asp-Asp) domain-containing protein
MEEKMNKSATSTGGSCSRFTHLCNRVLLSSMLVTFPCTLPVIAQEGEVGFKSTTPVASPDPIRNIRDAAVKAESAEPIAPAGDAVPPGAVEPQVIAKTFLATAYCLKGQTASGVLVRRGIIAADPKILPLGSVVRLHAGSYSGIYTVMDTGGAIRGQRIDIYLPTRAEAIRFGSRRIKVEVLRHGWEPAPVAEAK